MAEQACQQRSQSLFDTRNFLGPNENELCEVLAAGASSRVERIVSTGQTTPPEQWYDQERDEWVALLAGSAELTWADGSVTRLKAGEWLLIRAHERHRVSYTSEDPACVWIAFHFQNEPS